MEKLIIQHLFHVQHGIGGSRTFESYASSDRWGSFSRKLTTNSPWPSAFANPFVKSIDKFVLLRKAREMGKMQEFHLATEELEIARTKGKRAWSSMFGESQSQKQQQQQESDGMTTIRMMMESIMLVTDELHMKLEPFQLDIIRACICSRAVKLLGQDLFKYVPNILEAIGLAGPVELDTMRKTELDELFLNYCKRFIAVVAPRRNGKSKSGKLFVAANAMCEEGAVIVMLAHQVNAILLYKDDILNYLQILSAKKEFRIKSSPCSIRLDFKQGRRSSFIYFVAGGDNVSI